MLTFLLAEYYLDIEMREQILKNFISLFTNHPKIPINIIAEPLLKVLSKSIGKKESIINVFDLEFF